MDIEGSSVICQGAEGVVYFSSFTNKPAIIKERLKKNYRIPELDSKLNKQRLLQEVRCIVKCRRAGILAPCIYLIEMEKNRIWMEYINGQTMKAFLRVNFASEQMLLPSSIFIQLSNEIGRSIGKMHDIDIVHGDLTTSNIMIRNNNDNSDNNETNNSDNNNQLNHVDRIVIIDFGLGMMKCTVEDKAVDLYVLERAFLSTHPGSEPLVAAILNSYRFSCRNGAAILTKLEQVRQRGRKREMIG
eukprot:gene8057-10915_t